MRREVTVNVKVRVVVDIDAYNREYLGDYKPREIRNIFKSEVEDTLIFTWSHLTGGLGTDYPPIREIAVE